MRRDRAFEMMAEDTTRLAERCEDAETALREAKRENERLRDALQIVNALARTYGRDSRKTLARIADETKAWAAEGDPADVLFRRHRVVERGQSKPDSAG